MNQLTIIKYAACGITCVAALVAGYRHGVSTTTDHYAAIIQTANASHAKALTAATDKARAEEANKAAALSAIDKKTIKDKNDEITSRDTLIAGYRSGAVRLRDRFTCGQGASADVREVATSASVSDGRTGGGLQPEDVRFLVSEASRANQYAKQLMSCQALVNADRGVK